MTEFLLLIFSIALFFLGNKAFNISTKNIKKTDPPSDISQVEKPQMLFIGFVLFFLGCWVFWLFLKTQM